MRVEHRSSDSPGAFDPHSFFFACILLDVSCATFVPSAGCGGVGGGLGTGDLGMGTFPHCLTEKQQVRSVQGSLGHVL